MCIRTNRPSVQTGTIGTLIAGERFHDNAGNTWMALALPPTSDSRMVACVEQAFGPGSTEEGTVTLMYSEVKLGRDEKGRLYTSRFLNDWYYEVPQVDGDAPTLVYGDDEGICLGDYDLGGEG
jgi:hypothetical protein